MCVWYHLIFLCVCFTFIHREEFNCLEQLECQGTDQRCCAEVVSFLCQVPLSYSHTRSRENHELTRVRLACQRLDPILKYFCNSLTFRWRERNQRRCVSWVIINIYWNKCDINHVLIGNKRQVQFFLRHNQVWSKNYLSKDTAFMLTFTPIKSNYNLV